MEIARNSGSQVSTSFTISYRDAFIKLESVNRGTHLVVDGCASLDYDVKDKLDSEATTGLRQKTLVKLLNHSPNPYQSIQSFRTAMFTDFILEGNIFLYWDGAYLYHLPAANVQVIPDDKTYIKGYTYNNDTKFRADEIIHIQDVSSKTIYRGASRLEAALRSIKILYSMQSFQDQFFENGATPGIVLETENTLSQTAKVRMLNWWKQVYSPKNGARSPMIIDNGLKVKSIHEVSFKELDFDTSIATHDAKILKALGVPPILLDGGNNANIAPNLRLMYLETILPITRKYTSAIERFFGYDIEVVTNDISALQPDLREISSYYSSLVNAGILKPDEAREAIRYEKLGGDMDKIRVPANIAGSATNPDTGGAPTKGYV